MSDDQTARTSPLSRPRGVAPVSGFAAAVLAAALAERLPRLADRVEAGALDPGLLAELREAYADLCEVAAAWRVWRQACAKADAEAVADARAGVVATLAAADFAPEIDTSTAATALGLSANRVRTLIRIGRLPARKVGRVWMVPVGELRTLEAERGSL